MNVHARGVRSTFTMAVLLISTVGCRREIPATTDSAQVRTVAPVSAAPSSPPPTAVANPCEHTGLWAACSVERRLKQSGFVVKKLDEKPERAGFNVKPIVYSLGSSRREVFIYDDERSAVRDLNALDTVTVAPTGSTGSWPSTPTLIRSANLAAVLLTENRRQAERVMLAITAGPPQAGSPR